MRILVTNDDGVDSPGLVRLAATLAEDGHDVSVVAPLEDRSGWGAALGPFHRNEEVVYQEVQLPGFVGPAYGVDGPPALAVMLARLGGFGPPPDLVVSGVNPGNNTGRSVLHSGTVGAALTAANYGVSGLAVSLASGEPLHWETACQIAALAVTWLLAAPGGTVLNLNLPNLPLTRLAGVRPARLAPFGTVRAAIAGDGGGRLQVEMRDSSVELSPDTDTALIRAGMATVTALGTIRSTGGVDAADWLDQRVETRLS
ncbi:MAG TPA: 5'/3'-nucleotidase SurE, partial [Acidimicrobiales bacterium]|nr:5'/3'-nucleotidase SurE [Acidimicrobiales bacterium]